MTLYLSDLVVTHRDRTLVDVADVRLEPGRPVTLVGESGSGKSLLAHALMGTLAPELGVRGRATIEGTHYDLADPSNRRTAWGRTLAMLPQEPVLALDPTMRVGAQVAEGVRGGAQRRDAQAAADGLLRDLGLDGYQRAYPHTLSGGMAQRVAFAAATIGGATALIADEPSKGLDRRARAGLADLLRRHLERDGLLLTITHDLDLARALGGDVLVMQDAQVVERGPVEDVLARPGHDYTRRLLAAEPARWRHDWQGTRAIEGSEVLVEATGISKAFDGVSLFDDLSLELRAAERVALTGPSGSGKTTLGNVLLRLRRPDTGSVRHAASLADGRLQKLYQDPALSFPAEIATGVAIDDVLRRHGVRRERLDELVTTLRLPPALLERRPGQVSGGELQRLAIIRAMLLEPLLVFADEPTSRLDLLTQQETMHSLMTQVAAQDCALVLVTHDEALAAAATSRAVHLGSRSTEPSTGVQGVGADVRV